jgi:hypothetical protein
LRQPKKRAALLAKEAGIGKGVKWRMRKGGYLFAISRRISEL